MVEVSCPCTWCLHGHSSPLGTLLISDLIQSLNQNALQGCRGLSALSESCHACMHALGQHHLQATLGLVAAYLSTCTQPRYI